MTALINNLQTAFEGEPWFGRSVRDILSEIDAETAMKKPAGNGHSILELVWHMVTWRQFTISRLKNSGEDLHEFEANDWRVLDHSNPALWNEGLELLFATQKELIQLLSSFDEKRLTEKVEGRQYNYEFLLQGIIQHDIYHLGQVAYVRKFLS